MPVIQEEESSLVAADVDQLLASSSNAFSQHGNAVGNLAGPSTEMQAPFSCPLHVDPASCDCIDLLEDLCLPASVVNPPAALAEPDYSKFENFIPLFTRPEHPCVYCRSRRLDCYMQRGASSCNACSSLFRECSLSQSKTLEAVNYDQTGQPTWFDTLHMVDEERTKEQGTFTGIKVLKSNARASSTSTPNPRISQQDDAPGSSKRNGIRFPRNAIKILRDWLDQHADHPYPSEAEKTELERQTELKPSQLANWLANARRRKKAVDRTQPRVCASPSLRPTTAAVPIPTGPEKAWDELNPFERWKHSPPENEPASMTDIAIAVANSDLPGEQLSTSPSSVSRRGQGSSNGSGLSRLRAPSTTSQETVTNQTSSLSASSGAFSQGSSRSHGSYNSFSSSLTGRKDHRRRRRAFASATGTKPSSDKKRIFQCTFCTDTFKSKYDWTRHEKSLHLSLEKWMCCPDGPIVTDPATGNKKCAYCELNNPSSDHINSHNHRQCDEKGVDSRTFYRKDHLRQHLRLMHGCELTPAMDAWKSFIVSINSRCGFCSQKFQMWQERVDHLTAHFKAGARMTDWTGCRGLDPAVAAQVTNAMPPYLIGNEAVSPYPFSATNRGSWRQAHDSQTMPGESSGAAPDAYARAKSPAQQETGLRSTCWEILTIKLGRYARNMAAQGTVMTDEMLQVEARRILYDCDDTWNQTAADNPEWLDLFKKAHGLDLIPNEIGGQGTSIPEDLEAYGDLGLRIPFAVQLQAINKSHAQTRQTANPSNVPGVYKEALVGRREALSEICKILAQEGVFYDGEQKCQHADCANNAVDVCAIDVSEGPKPHLQRWCSHELTLENSKTLIERLGEAGYDADHQKIAKQGIPALRVLYDEIPDVQGSRVNQHNDVLADGQLVQSNAAIMQLDSRARGLEALNRMEAPWRDDCACSPQAPAQTRYERQPLPAPDQRSLAGQSLHLPRHKYELPADRVRRFATATGAWEDSGVMPAAFSTAPTPATYDPSTTTTGAMMEFLGGDLAAGLPFSTDALTTPMYATDLTQPMDLDSDFHLGNDFLDPNSFNMQQQQQQQQNDMLFPPADSAANAEILRELDLLIDSPATSYPAQHIAPSFTNPSPSSLLSRPNPSTTFSPTAPMDLSWALAPSPSPSSHNYNLAFNSPKHTSPQQSIPLASSASNRFPSEDLSTTSSSMPISTYTSHTDISDDALFDDLTFDDVFEAQELGMEGLEG